MLYMTMYVSDCVRVQEKDRQIDSETEKERERCMHVPTRLVDLTKCLNVFAYESTILNIRVHFQVSNIAGICVLLKCECKPSCEHKECFVCISVRKSVCFLYFSLESPISISLGLFWTKHFKRKGNHLRLIARVCLVADDGFTLFMEHLRRCTTIWLWFVDL